MNRQFADQYGNLEQWHWWFRGRQRILDMALQRELQGKPSLTIASLGCGPVEGLRWLLSFAAPNGHVVGIDADPVHARPMHNNIDCVIGKVEAVPLASKSFDVVLALDVLEHLDDDAAGLSESGETAQTRRFALGHGASIAQPLGNSGHCQPAPTKIHETDFEARFCASTSFPTQGHLFQYNPVSASSRSTLDSPLCRFSSRYGKRLR
jgi:SAM-dependent methyltransferase